MSKKENFKKNQDRKSRQKTNRSDKEQKFTKCNNYDKETSNNITWWKKPNFMYLFDQATKVPFYQINGAKTNTSPNVNGGANPGNYPPAKTSPGILELPFVTGIGFTRYADDPVNLAFNMIYAEIGAKTSIVNLPYTSADLALFTVSYSSTCAHIAAAKRVIEASNTLLTDNMYFGRAMVTALGFDYDDISKHKANYVAELNDLINQVNAMTIPRFCDVFARHYTLARNIYSDNVDSTKGQFYVFTPQNIYNYVDTASKCQSDNIDDLIRNKMAVMQITSRFEAYLYVIRDSLSYWWNSSDRALISMSLQKAFSSNDFLRLDGITELSWTTPIYDNAILKQIDNATVVPVDMESLHITQDPAANAIVFKPKSKVQFMYNPDAILPDMSLGHTIFERYTQTINMYDGDISPDSIMRSTRLMQNYYDPTMDNYWDQQTDVFIKQDDGTVWATWNLYYGTEIVTGMKFHNIIYSDNKLSTFSLNTVSIPQILVTGKSGFADDGQILPAECGTTNVVRLFTSNYFQYAHKPRVYVFVWNLDQATFNPQLMSNHLFVGTTTDVNIFTEIDNAQLNELNYAAIRAAYDTSDMSVISPHQ